MCESSGASFSCPKGRGHVGGRRVAKDKEFDEGPNQNNNRELTKEEALSERETRTS